MEIITHFDVGVFTHLRKWKMENAELEKEEGIGLTIGEKLTD